MPVTAGQDKERAAGAGVSRRPVRSRVRHGQASCADHGCAFSACRQAALRARRRRDRDRAKGVAARVDPAPVAARAAVVVRRGMSAQDIADASGIAVTLIRRLLREPAGRPVRIARGTAEAVLGVALPGRERPPSPGRGLTCAAAAAAVLAELEARGWTAAYLAARLRTSAATVAAVRDGSRRRITVALDLRVHRLRARLAATDPRCRGDPGRRRGPHPCRRPRAGNAPSGGPGGGLTAGRPPDSVPDPGV
ncbi:hypothetical protein AB0D08_39740 [Kitasatospora sp. NPDC048540]|uniref:hypothetical protein n=1 Tax=Kitasatospora sp. NPDC048540 TaxID=3155634 RepID=UPI0033DE6B6C